MTNKRRAFEGNEGKLRCEMSSHLHARIEDRVLFAYEYNKNKNTKSGKRTTIPSKWKHPRRRMQAVVRIYI